MAVRVGFEPTEPVKVQRFSRPPDSTTLAPHRAVFISIYLIRAYGQISTKYFAMIRPIRSPEFLLSPPHKLHSRRPVGFWATFLSGTFSSLRGCHFSSRPH